MARLRKQALDGKIETLLLAVLERGPSYGYQIGQDLLADTGGRLRLGEGTIYPVLHRLEERELITATWRTADNGRDRKYYRLTPRGRAALAEQRRQWADLVAVMTAVLESGGSGTVPA